MNERLPEDVAQLAPGTRYRITFTDCCVNGSFDGVFQHVEWVPNAPGDPPNYPAELIFDTGRIDTYGAWEATELG
jgi:hypothetical protein